ncbi:MAG: hypothetical protein ACW99J_15505 [Candidatus Thorarchaeota archaeon]|jgi:hypothetical protein
MAKTGLTRNWVAASLQIPNGSSLSASLVIAGRPIITIGMPTAWTAASISFDVSACENGTFFPLYGDNGIQISVPAAASTQIGNHNKLEKLAGWYAMRIRSGSVVGEEIDQGAARTLIVFSSG